ncbi:MAG TPA: hypothetical protein VKS22_12875 [Candidatus Binataceae bacterium]|nr:hypothetical protein [Candidatus Binataceae bacterium]
MTAVGALKRLTALLLVAFFLVLLACRDGGTNTLVELISQIAQQAAARPSL